MFRPPTPAYRQAGIPPPQETVSLSEGKGEEAVGFQSFRMRLFYIMGNCHSYKIEIFHTLGTPESERINVTALNLFHPTASPLFQNVGFFNTVTQPPRGRGRGYE